MIHIFKCSVNISVIYFCRFFSVIQSLYIYFVPKTGIHICFLFWVLTTFGNLWILRIVMPLVPWWDEKLIVTLACRVLFSSRDGIACPPSSTYWRNSPVISYLTILCFNGKRHLWILLHVLIDTLKKVEHKTEL